MNKHNTSSFFKRNQTQKLNITTKVSQKEFKKNKKNAKNNTQSVSDNDFDKLMEENNLETTPERLNSYLSKITDSNILIQLVEEGIKGETLINKVKYENVSGSQLLNTILKKYNKPDNLSWLDKEEYGTILSNLLDNNFQDQLLCLLLIQNHCIQIGMPKITFKDKQMYYIKLIFQLMFTQDMIDESVYWKWYELSPTFTDINEDTKNKICIQTTEFFNILKLSFIDEDYENNEDENNKSNKQLNNQHKLETEKLEIYTRVEKVKNKIEDVVPEEQDYYMVDEF